MDYARDAIWRTEDDNVRMRQRSSLYDCSRCLHVMLFAVDGELGQWGRVKIIWARARVARFVDENVECCPVANVIHLASPSEFLRLGD